MTSDQQPELPLSGAAAGHGLARPPGSASVLEPKMTWEEIKANHREAIKRRAIDFYKSKESVFAGEPPMKRWRSCVQLIVETWMMLGPQRDNLPTRTIYL
jgi:hypothetical protein